MGCFLAGAFIGSLVMFSAMVLCICADDKGRKDKSQYEAENKEIKEKIEQLIKKYE